MTVQELRHRLTQAIRELHFWHYVAQDEGHEGKHPECTTFSYDLIAPGRCCECEPPEIKTGDAPHGLPETLKPPQSMIDWALRCAMASPCQKSKRGVVIFEPERCELLATGHNYPPLLSCDGSAECRRDCGRICVHAEQFALRNLLKRMKIAAEIRDWHPTDIQSLHVLHVKAVGGVLVPGPGPSCEQCSKLILDAGLGGVWLYEAQFVTVTDMSNEWHPLAHEEQVVPASWHFYPAEEFHRTTLRNLGLHGG